MNKRSPSFLGFTISVNLPCLLILLKNVAIRRPPQLGQRPKDSLHHPHWQEMTRTERVVVAALLGMLRRKGVKVEKGTKCAPFKKYVFLCAFAD